MNDIKGRIADFLKKYGMDAEQAGMDTNCRRFTEEMQKGLGSGGSSLMMIPTYISMEKELPVDEDVIVIDAGGTNLRVAVIRFNSEGKPVVEDFKLYAMPGTRGEITKEEFFDTVAGYLKPVLHRSDKISFCFSYPVKILPNKDGRLIKFSKEVRVSGMEGELIGENLLKAVEKLGASGKKSIILLNDTVATLLAGKASFPDRVFSSYIGFILGTGTNTSYIEKKCNIGKVPELKDADGSMLINIESGDYKGAPRGTIDEEFDSRTVNPGSFMFEKAISGAYQGGLILTVLRKAAEDGLFSQGFAGKLAAVEGLSSREIDDFLYYPHGSGTLAGCCKAGDGNDDRVCLYHLIDAIIERAARFVAFNLAAVVQKTGKGGDPCEPVCITADGSTFYKSKLFRSKLDHYIKTFMNDKLNLYCEIVRVEDGTLIGTAIAGLLN